MKPRDHKLLPLLLLIALACFSAGCHQQTPALGMSVQPACMVPELVSLPLSEAEEALIILGISFRSSEVYSAEIPAGSVVATSPEGGASLPNCQQEVLLFVSRGPEDTQHSIWENWPSGQVEVSDHSALELRQESNNYRWVPQAGSDPIYHYELMPNVTIEGDFSFSVETQRESGGDGSASGLIIQFQDSERYYLFSLFDVGYIALDEGLGDARTAIVEPMRIEPTYPGDINQMQVIGQEGHYSFFVNNTLVYEHQDETPGAVVENIGIAVRLKDAETVFNFQNPRLDAIRGAGGVWSETLLRWFDFEEDIPADLMFKTFGDGSQVISLSEGVMRWDLSCSIPTRFRALLDPRGLPLSEDSLSISLDLQRLSGSPVGCKAGLLFNNDTLTGTYQFVRLRDDNHCEVYQYSAITQIGEVRSAQRNCHVDSGKINYLKLDITPDSLNVYVNGYQVFDLLGSPSGSQLNGTVGIQVECDPGQYIFEFDNFRILDN